MRYVFRAMLAVVVLSGAASAEWLRLPPSPAWITRIALVGDSHFSDGTHGAAFGGLQVHSVFVPIGLSIENGGYGGARTTDWLPGGAKFTTFAAQCNAVTPCDLCFMHLGQNDMLFNSAVQYESNWAFILADITTNGRCKHSYLSYPSSMKNSLWGAPEIARWEGYKTAVDTLVADNAT